MAKEIRKPGYSIEHDSWFLPLTQGVIALVDADMVPVLSQHNWCAQKSRSRWYAKRGGRRHDGKRPAIFMHRVVVDAPDGMEVDHIEHCPAASKLIDNRWSNLRVCSGIQNSRNRRPTDGGTSVFKGVCWDRSASRWVARIRIGHRRKYLGQFPDETEAARAYDAAALGYHGEFALTNKQLGLLRDRAA